MFEESHREEISVAIKLSNKTQRKNGKGEAKKLEEKGLVVVSRALVATLENNLVQENQMANGRSGIEVMQDAKTNTALDLLSNPLYTIDLLLCRKLSKEITLIGDARIRDGNRGSGATAEATLAVGGRRQRLC